MGRARAGVWVLALGTFAAAARGGVTPEQFPLVRPLQPEGEARRAAGMFRLDEALLARSANDYSNVRILDDRDREVPFVVRPMVRGRAVTRESEIPVTVVDFRTLPENRVAVTVERNAHGSRTAATALVLVTGQRDFERKVTVSSSADGQVWQPLVRDSPIGDYTRFPEARNDRVKIPADTNRLYLIEVSSLTGEPSSPLTRMAGEGRLRSPVGQADRAALNREPIRVERVRLFEERDVNVDAGRKLREYAVRNLSVVQRPADNATVLTFEADRPPLREVTLEIGDRQFSRSVTVEANVRAHRRSGWVHAGNGTISRVPVGSVPIERPFVVLAKAVRFPAYRLIVWNLDGPPLAVAGVKANGEVHEAVFHREPGRQYRVLYGAETAPAPRYDAAAALNGLAPGEADEFRLGDPAGNPAYAGPKGAGWSGPRRQAVCAALAIGALVLLWVVHRAARRKRAPVA